MNYSKVSHEYWLDIGRIEEYERANHEINI